MTPRIITAVGSVAVGVLGLGGCGDMLPQVERIVSLRPLAMRVEVDEPGMAEDAATMAEAMPLSTATVVPLFVDPDGPLNAARIAAEVEPVWLACNLQPVQGLFGCLSDALPLAVADVPECPPPDLAGFDPSSGMLPTTPSPCRITADDPARPRYTVPIDASFLLGGDIELTMVGHAPGSGDTALCLAQLLGADDPDPACVYATQRLAVGPDGALVQLAQMFGVPAEALPAVPDPIPDPDRHPRIEQLSLQAFEDASDEAPMIAAAILATGDVIELPWGARIELEAQAREDDLQTYVIPRDDGTFTERDETYDARWFVTWGALLSPTSNDPLAKNTWRLTPDEQDDTEVPPHALATVFYVLRDDRQGVTWTYFQVRVQGGPPSDG
ncbi:MAG: hypothetical protein IPH07_10395 [Deltaproteobacteria bacterium]|nr:hypothetical protein [Deltaproteobacteria bacterium]MBK8237145.1 hypothetical protein [Deltaproteobacteria bacterium]